MAGGDELENWLKEKTILRYQATVQVTEPDRTGMKLQSDGLWRWWGVVLLFPGWNSYRTWTSLSVNAVTYDCDRWWWKWVEHEWGICNQKMISLTFCRWIEDKEDNAATSPTCLWRRQDAEVEFSCNSVRERKKSLNDLHSFMWPWTDWFVN